MKKNIVLLPLLFAMVSTALAKNVTFQAAQTVAQSFLKSKMGSALEISLVNFAEKSEFPNFYVFGNEYCFVIIAADDCVHPVLGYSTEGGFGTDEMPEDVVGWLKRYEDVLTALSETKAEASPDVQAEWKCLLNGGGLEPKTRTRVMPLIKTKWSHKKAPFNNLCPADPQGPDGHARGGCGAGAMSQLMNYWEHPVRGVGSFSYSPEQLNHQCPQYGLQSANFGETVYDWDNMKNVYALGYNETEGLAVATLIYHCAVSLQMNFGPQNSYTNPARIATALKTYFDYSQSTNYQEKSNYSDSEWKTMLKDDLDLGRPVIYRGRDTTNHLGHIFICDGYDENEYFHFNFDWAGNYDGYYTIGNIDINGTDYDHFNTAVFNCFPNPTSVNAPANVNATVLNQNVTITWSSVPNASYYKLYRDEELIANDLQSTNYTDNNVPYGTHSYYVKSVKVDGTMSLRSAPVSADVHFMGPAPTNLQASVSGHNVSLSWQSENPETAILQYTTGTCTGSGGVNAEGNRTCWAQRFPVSILQNYTGMAIEKVAFYARKTGDYTVGVYKGDVTNTNELVYEQSISAAAGSWYDIVFTTPVALDCTQDLWIVFSSYVYKPASYCSYSGPYHDDALLFSNTQSGVLVWQRLTDNKAWLMKTYLTDGTYTYNLYRDGEAVANNLIDNTYTDSNLPDGIYDYHVTTNYFGGESDPSNIAIADVHFPSPVPSNLQAMVNDHDVNLSWDAPTSESAILQYGLGNCIGGGGFNQNQNNNPDFYWAHRYPTSTLQQFAGMAVEKVSFYFRTEGAYTLFVYKGNETQPTELLHQQSYTATAGSWQDIVFDTPVEIDFTQDLWMVFLSNVRRPASCCVFDDVTDARLYSYDGVTWRNNFNQYEERSWLMKTYITDGTYTYNLYRNGEAVASNLTDNTYTDSDLPDGIYDYHVTTNYFGGESDASNTVQVQVGDPAYTVISGYGLSNKGYYLIASPFDSLSPDDITGMTNGDFDLYHFDQAQEMEWRNYKANAFGLMAGKGYLYAHKTDVALRFEGSQPYNGNGTFTLEYVEGHPLAGWNLIGNPYLFDVNSCTTEHVAYGCYRMNEAKDDLVLSEISETHPLKPLEACFVKATAENATITFNPHRHVATNPRRPIQIVVAENGQVVDRLWVATDEELALQKLSLKEKGTRLFAIRGQDALAIVPCDGIMLPFCFQAGYTGTFTLTVELDGTENDYLHLVDTKTGNDVDLLETPSYMFEAKPSDDPNRFKLVFKPKQ